MRDDDDLPVLSAVVRGGDAAVIRSMRLRDTRSEAVRGAPDAVSRRARRRAANNGASDALADVLATAPERAPYVRGSGPFGTLAGLDIDASARELTDAPDVARIDLGHAPVGIDASRDRDGRRASRLLADVRAALDEMADDAATGSAGRGSDVAVNAGAVGRGDAPHELDDTLPLDDAASASARHAPTRVFATDSSPDRRDADPRAGARDIDVDDLVDRIVDRHVAALRRDVREALERALAHVDD